jgi:hypothetical protein
MVFAFKKVNGEMKLIEYDGLSFKIADEALLVKPIRDLFLQDKTVKKEKFWQQISYLWFMCDPRSSYMYITSEEERAIEVKKQEGLSEDWEPSDLLQDAMAIYKRQTTTTSSLLLAGMRKGIENVRKFLEEIDLFATDKNDRPIYQVSTMTSALKQVPDLAKALVEAEKSLAKDFAEEDKTRGAAVKAIGEDI